MFDHELNLNSQVIKATPKKHVNIAFHSIGKMHFSSSHNIFIINAEKKISIGTFHQFIIP